MWVVEKKGELKSGKEDRKEIERDEKGETVEWEDREKKIWDKYKGRRGKKQGRKYWERGQVDKMNNVSE